MDEYPHGWHILVLVPALDGVVTFFARPYIPNQSVDGDGGGGEEGEAQHTHTILACKNKCTTEPS